MKKTVSVLLAFVAALCGVRAQTSFNIQAPNLVGVNEQFNVTFVVSGDGDVSDFSWDSGNDFQLVWGPQKGKSSSTSIINGKVSRSSQTTFTYILMPKSVGHFTLNPAHVKVKGKEYTSNAPQIEVVSDGAASQGGSGSASSGGSSQRSSGSAISSGDLFLRLSFSKRRVMVGEPLTATLKLYQRVNIAGFENAKFPDFNGFWSEELQAPQNIEFQRESLDGLIYNSAVLRSWTLIPQKAGDIKVDAAELVCLVNVRAPSVSTGSIFDDFFQDDVQTIRKRVTTEPVTVKVTALPAGAPASFGGGVGRFRVEATLTRDSLNAHEAASLKISVTGTGNTALLEAPKPVFPPDFEVYDVKSGDITGGKVFEYPFIPRSHGSFTIAPVQYSYFDMASGKYVTLETEPLDIKVGKGESSSGGEPAGVMTAVSSGKDVRNIGSDIRFIFTGRPSFSRAGSIFVGTAGYFLLYLLLIAVAVAVFLVLRKVAGMKADVAGSRNRGAGKMARRRLSRAAEFRDKSLQSAFYEELHKALLGYVSDKLNIDMAEMSKDNIVSRLVENGAAKGLAEDYVALLDACEYARYAPESGSGSMSAHYDKAVEVISEIESEMNRKPKSKGNGAAAAAMTAMLLVSSFAGAELRAASTVAADSLWTAGVEAYSAGQWDEALQDWESIRDSGLESDALYYNIGNAYFRSDNLAKAILSYERALKLNPSHSDARYNLEFARTRLQDKISAVPEFFLGAWLRKLSALMSPTAWGVAALLLFALFLGMGLLFGLARSGAGRKTGFIVGIVALVLSLSANGMALRQRAGYLDKDSAIVTSAVASVKSSPSGDSATDLFILHEGTKVRLLDEVGGWRNVELADGRQGWMRSSDIEVI